MSLTLSTVAIALSCISRARWVRVMLMIGFGFTLLLVMQFGWIFLAFSGSPMGSPLGPGSLALVLAWGCFVLVAFGFALASARLAHPEENRSTLGRVAALAVVGSALALTAVEYLPHGNRDWIEGLGIATLCACTPAAILFVTEPEAMGSRVRQSIPRGRIRAFLLAPLLPGGGRGALFVMLLLGLLCAGELLIVGLGPTRPLLTARPVLLASAFAGICLLGPSGLASRLCVRVQGRWLVRGLIVGLAVLTGFAASFLAFFARLEVSLFGDRIEVGTFRGPSLLAVLAVGCVLAALVNLPRILRGLREIEAARRENAARPAIATTPGVDVAHAAPGS